MAKKTTRVKGFHHDDDEDENTEEEIHVEEPKYETASFAAAKAFIQNNFCPAFDFNDSTVQCNSLDLLNKLSKQHSQFLVVDEIYSIMKELGYKEANLPGGSIKPVWLLKEKG